ncbi:hypothetical protein KJ586_03000 [Patescibacteria group bacterium]|nr:hypothetical protein [Patescibacteria group bacterium]MBU4455451.1 hypothetical protein [Patescibacteria group bacterium]MCG2690708.1 hypothetical protein [Candidatus Parcubacteria bacterium]
MLISGIKKYFRSKKEKRAKIKEIIRKIDFSEMENLPKQKAMKRDIKAAGRRVIAEMSRRGMGY